MSSNCFSLFACISETGHFFSTSHAIEILIEMKAYQPPVWASGLKGVPKFKVSLGHFPTPIHKIRLPDSDKEIWVKREDLSEMMMSGNKVRKLEFLLADALQKQCDAVVTIGGIQSNHTRATAIASRMIGLEPYVILRTDPDQKLEEIGNLLTTKCERNE